MKLPSSLVRRPIADRSIRVLVTPTPVTFAERRSVLQVLEQYGPVEVFKMTPGYHANFLSVTKEESSARQLVASSPLTYRLPPPQPKTNVHIADLVDGQRSNVFNVDSNQPSITNSQQGLDTHHDTDYGINEDAAMRDDADFAAEPEQAQFMLEIFPEPEYMHEFSMCSSPLYHSWPTTYVEDKSFVTSTLKQLLPQNMASRGLAHWLLEQRYGSSGKTDSKFERLQLKSWLPSKMSKPQEPRRWGASSKQWPR